MFLAPAQSAKAGDPSSATSILSAFAEAVRMYSAYWPLAAVWTVLLVMVMKKERVRVVVSSVLLLGSVFANFILTFAASYAGRCAWPSLVWMTVAVTVLFPTMPPESAEKAFMKIPAIFTALLLPFAAYKMVFGVYDIYRTGRDMRDNVAVIESCRDSGETDIEVKCVYPATKYSAIYNLKYLDTETPYTWPNENMATYFGVNSITALP